MITIFFPNNNKLLPTYLMALVELAIFWNHRATISATPLSIALDSAKRHKGIIKE